MGNLFRRRRPSRSFAFVGRHPCVGGRLTGRRLGAYCGQSAWALARQYFDGSILRTPVTLSIHPSAAGGCVVSCDTRRGLFYKLQSSTDLNAGFMDESAGFSQALDSPTIQIDRLAGRRKFYRVVWAPAL